MKCEILKADISHLHEIIPLFDAYRVNYGKKSDAAGAERFLRKLINNKRSVIYLACSKRSPKKPLGFAQLYPFQSSTGMRDYWVLNDLFVNEQARGKAVGKQLIETCIEFARDQKSLKLVLETTHDNYPARKLYDSYGFKVERDFFTYTLDLSQ